MAVTYGGRVVEDGATTDVLTAPRHPYTAALSAADPARAKDGTRLLTIGASPPVLTGDKPGCVFCPRCTSADGTCATPSRCPARSRDGRCCVTTRPRHRRGRRRSDERTSPLTGLRLCRLQETRRSEGRELPHRRG
uniref:Oligopeptide/dipeptide ABC transporter C-terminal domain-containing protein n=1 Tax=Streptomyces sp. NBC_00093 TaxID=2975649 RepID=A0AAU2AJF6_9ACTN